MKTIHCPYCKQTLNWDTVSHAVQVYSDEPKRFFVACCPKCYHKINKFLGWYFRCVRLQLAFGLLALAGVISIGFMGTMGIVIGVFAILPFVICLIAKIYLKKVVDQLDLDRDIDELKQSDAVLTQSFIQQHSVKVFVPLV